METEIIRGIAPAPRAYLRTIGMKEALCSLIGWAGCCNPGAERVLISAEQTAQRDTHLSCLSERKGGAEERMMRQKERPCYINLLPCGFCMTVISCIFCCSSALLNGTRDNRRPAEFPLTHLIILHFHARPGVAFFICC